MRTLITIILMAGVFITPWWLLLPAIIVSVLLYKRFFAALLPALLLDIIHGGASLAHPFVSATLIVTVLLLVLLFLEIYLRDNVRI